MRIFSQITNVPCKLQDLKRNVPYVSSVGYTLHHVRNLHCNVCRLPTNGDPRAPEQGEGCHRTDARSTVDKTKTVP